MHVMPCLDYAVQAGICAKMQHILVQNKQMVILLLILNTHKVIYQRTTCKTLLWACFPTLLHQLMGVTILLCYWQLLKGQFLIRTELIGDNTGSCLDPSWLVLSCLWHSISWGLLQTAHMLECLNNIFGKYYLGKHFSDVHSLHLPRCNLDRI